MKKAQQSSFFSHQAMTEEQFVEWLGQATSAFMFLGIFLGEVEKGGDEQQLNAASRLTACVEDVIWASEDDSLPSPIRKDATMTTTHTRGREG